LLYDTLKLARSLRDKAHFTNEQAEGLAEVLNEAGQESVATKSDITALSNKIDIAARDLKIWTGLIAVVLFGLIVGAITIIEQFSPVDTNVSTTRTVTKN